MFKRFFGRDRSPQAEDGDLIRAHLATETAKQRVRELETELAQAKRDYINLRDKNTDLSAQNEELRKGTVLTPTALEEIRRKEREYQDMHQQIASITVYLRNNFKEEMERGDYAGKSLAEIIQMCLAAYKRRNVQ